MDVDPETQLLCDKAFQGGDIQSFKQHISQLTLAQLNGKNGRGQTALLCASRQGHLEFVRALVQADGIDVNLGDSNVTPLHAASYFGHAEVVTLLLLGGANPDIKNNGIDRLTPKEEATGQVCKISNLILICKCLALWKIYDQQGLAGLASKYPHLVVKRSVSPLTSKSSRAPLRKRASSNNHGNYGKVISKKGLKGSGQSSPTFYDAHYVTLKKGKLQMREKEGKSSWKEKDCVLVASKESIKINILSPKDGRIERDVTILTSDPNELFCGVGSREEYAPTLFWVLGTDMKKVQFKAPSWQERRDWFEIMYRALLPKISFTEELRTADSWIEEWKSDVEGGKITTSPSKEVWSAVEATDELSFLIQNIIDITEDDIFWSTRKDLDSITHGLKRGDQFRDVILEIIKVTRQTPHEMADWQSEKYPFSSIEELAVDLQSKLERIQGFKGQPQQQQAMHASRSEGQLDYRQSSSQETSATKENICALVEKLKSIYVSFLENQGTKGAPALFRCGEEKIASRVLPVSFCQLITSAINKEKITNPADIPRPTLRIGNVMFSLNPCDPGIEQSVSALNQMIFGQEGHIIPLSIIAKLDIFGSTILCKCYSAVDGITLKDLFTKAPELVPYLDHENLSIHYLSSILSRPAKQNMTDLIVSPLVALYEGKEEKRLMLYANPGTVYFCDEFSKKMPSHRGRDGVTSTGSFHKVMLRTAIWLLPQTKENRNQPLVAPEIHPEVAAKLVSLIPEEIVLRFFLSSASQNAGANHLYDQGILSRQELYTENIGGVLSHFQDKEPHILLNAFKALRKTIKDGTKTFLGLLSVIYPLLSVVYRSCLMTSVPSKLEEWKTLPQICDVRFFCACLADLQQWFFSPTCEPVETNPKIQAKIFPNFLKELTTLPDNNSPKICKPEALIEEFLTKEVNFFYFPPAHQKEILWDLTKLQLQNLTIRGSSSINTKNLEDFLENHTLQHVSIIECSGVVESDIEAIHAKCNTLDKNRTMNIIFENCENLSARVGELRYKNLKIWVVTTEALDQLTTDELLSLMKKVVETNTSLVSKKVAANLFKLDKSNVESVAVELEANKPKTDEEREFLAQLFHKHHIPKIAIEFGSMRLLKLSHKLMGPLFSCPSRTLDTMLKLAINNKQTEMAEFLIALGASREADFNFLLRVLQCQMYDIAEMILYENNSLADVSSLNEDNMNALASVCSLPETGITNSFLPYFLSINPSIHVISSKAKNSVLHYAAFHNADETIRLLLKEEPSLLFLRNTIKQTAYAYMCLNGRGKMSTASVLIECGWKPTLDDVTIAVKAKDPVGLLWLLNPNKFHSLEAPLKSLLQQQTQQRQQQQQQQKEQNNGAVSGSGPGSPPPNPHGSPTPQRRTNLSANNPVMSIFAAAAASAPSRHSLPAPGEVLRAPMPVVNLCGMKSVDGKTLLHMAEGNPLVIETLLAVEPKLAATTNSMNKTVLWEMLEGEKVLEKTNHKVVEILQKYGGDINAYHPTMGTTLLHEALKNTTSAPATLLSVIRTLFELGADPRVHPKDNQTTTLHIAVQTNNMDIIRLVGDQYKKFYSNPSELKEVITKRKDAATGMAPSKLAGKSKPIAKEAEKYFKELCKK